MSPIWLLSTAEWEAKHAVSLVSNHIYARAIAYRQLH